MKHTRFALQRRWPLVVVLIFVSVLSVALPALRGGGGRVALTPDLIVWDSRLRDFLYGWSLDRDEQPGHVLLRLTTAVSNQGTGPIELIGGEVKEDGTQEVLQRLYYDDGTFEDTLAGTFIHHPEHEHIHFEGYAEYRLREVAQDGSVGDVIATSDKISFCLVDVLAYNRRLPGAPFDARYLACSRELQGISVGWSDVYDQSLPDQWIDVTDVPNGRYWLEVEVDPEDRLIESDESNNIARIKIVLRK